MLNTKGWLQDSHGDNKVRGENEVLLPINTETVRAELLSEYIESSCDVFGELMDNVEVGIGFDETSGRGSNSG